MKAFLFSIIIVCAVLIPTTGCITASNPAGTVVVGGHTIDPVTTGDTVKIVAKLGAIEAIRRAPSSRVYFQISANAIAAAIASGDYNPTNLQAAIAQLCKNTVVPEGIADALSIYSTFWGQLVAQKLSNQSPYTVPVLRGLSAGIIEALGVTASSTTTATAKVITTTTTIVTNKYEYNKYDF